MISVINVDTWGFEHAIRGMRNPMNSWDKSDTEFGVFTESVKRLGESDLGLMRRLYQSGPEHRKYLRQMFVSMDIKAPLYWWKEFDTYKVGTVANSCSTMHKIHSKEFTLLDFSLEHIGDHAIMQSIISELNTSRDLYNQTGNNSHWWRMIQLLPSSYNQIRTITMNYENVVNIISQRERHKLDEWRHFVAELKKLPFIGLIMEE